MAARQGSDTKPSPFHRKLSAPDEAFAFSLGSGIPDQTGADPSATRHIVVCAPSQLGHVEQLDKGTRDGRFYEGAFGQSVQIELDKLQAEALEVLGPLAQMFDD